jgi:transcriptional regulator with XRE-family HTH domain
MRGDLEPIRKVLAGNIKKHRKNFGYSQEKLAEKAGLSAQTLNDIEGCRRWISARTMSRLARALNIAEYQLFVPEPEEAGEKNRVSPLQSLIALQHKLVEAVNLEFDRAKDSGGFS